MPNGYRGKILRVDLSARKTWVETPEEEDKDFYRRYWGGSCLGAYYLLKAMTPGIDALDPGNVLVFATSVVTGAEAPGFARYSVVSKSPLSEGVGEALAEGFWGPELKFCGYDAIVIQGKAKRPVYLSIHDEDVEIKDAQAFLGANTAEATRAIRAELGDADTKVACIGPAGENLVRYASIVSDVMFMNARGGMGAVMGSKNLKAVAVRGSRSVEVAEADRIEALAKQFEEHFQENFVNKAVYDAGTASFLGFLNSGGLVSSRNAQTSEFSGAEKISGEHIHQSYFDKRIPCFNCPAACRRVLKDVKALNVDPAYGAPELEVMMAFGNGCNIDDLGVLIKTSELCARYGMDYTSTGVTIAFAMECFERGILTKEDTDGMELRFGNADVMTDLVERIARRRGVGALLAEGTKRAAKKLGKASEPYAMHVKGLELPLHDPRTKAMLGLSYALSPIGPDDLAVEHDTDFDANAPELFMDRVATLGIWKRREATDLGPEKVRMLCYLQQVFSFMDSLCLCKFAFVPCRYYSFAEMVELIRAITGWEVSLWELMKVGERRLNLQRAFNLREGIGLEQDRLPDRVYEPIRSGPNKGVKMSRQEVEAAKQIYYRMRDWNSTTGWPSREKLEELDIGWLSRLTKSKEARSK
jgi:aldehyde:ferredoxin oxidoreductase